MFNNKLLATIIIGSVVLLLAACNSSANQSEVTVENEPTNDKTEEVQNVNQDREQENELEETEEEKELVLPSADLQKGDQNDDILLLQEILNKVDYNISLTTMFDRDTVWAITDFQLQSEDLYVTGIYDEDTKHALENVLDQGLTITAGEGLAHKEDEYKDDETVVISNPYEVLALVNKQRALPEDYIPSDLVVPDVRFPFVEDLPKKQMRKVAADALEKLFADADLQSLDLFAQSGYRSYERQDYLFASYVSNYGEEQANTFSARPGESEHQSGLTMDVTSPHVNYSLVTEFGETEEGIWLQENAAKYGFIIRYPKGKEHITGYQYEPWHLRYVGVKAATEIMERGITLEEYFEEKFN